ncbi:MAG: sugar ABC transporter permease [Vallitaleaceae bacterium]|nr:sugar ABC transporter permease [Vallitaleaceae bacterium]
MVVYTKKHNGFNAILFLLPAMCIYVFVVVVPAIYSLFLSLFKWNGIGSNVKKFVGIDNYVHLIFEDSTFKTALMNNTIWTVLSLVLTTFVALSFAMILNKQFKFRVIYRGVFYFPYILSGIVVALMWSWIYHPLFGFLNKFLDFVHLEGLKIGWLSNPHIALYSVFAAALWQYVGAPMVIFLAGLQSIPNELYEASSVDGATKWKTFFTITIPMLKETFVIVIATTLIGSMKVFDIIYAMTGGGPAQSTQTMASLMYAQMIKYSNVGLATAISWILVIVVGVITVPYIMHMAKED